jgi:putative ABC transport system ATP-binding protein
MALTAPSIGEAGAEILVSGVRHAFDTDHGDVIALDELALDVSPGGYVALTGPSGAGKSTFLSLLGGLEPIQVGSISVGGRDLAHLDGDALAEYRRETVGFIFQHYGLIPVLTALENVELALALSGVGRAERRRRALELLDAVGLADRRDHRPTALSGGERQRVAIARAIANRPRLLLADEPTGNLDDDAAMRVLDLLEVMRTSTGCTLLVVTHNARVAARAAERYRLAEGRLVA